MEGVAQKGMGIKPPYPKEQPSPTDTDATHRTDSRQRTADTKNCATDQRKSVTWGCCISSKRIVKYKADVAFKIWFPSIKRVDCFWAGQAFEVPVS
jgi:hypothetical protein